MILNFPNHLKQGSYILKTKQFGGKLNKDLKNKYSNSPHWEEGSFKNLVKTGTDISIHNLPKMLYKQFFDKTGRVPERPIPIEKFDKEAFLKSDNQAKFIWFGHSVILLRLEGKTILIDPMLGDNASPIAPFKTKRFSENTLDLIDEFPNIDLLIMTHDHYDHLDLASIEKLKVKVAKYYVGLGVGRHLEAWDIAPEKITEFDWWDEHNFENIKITYTPTRHASGRGIKDQSKCLWGGWVFKTESENVYFSGDGGYGDHFKEIGKKLGPFDFGFMECGQYNENWHQIHMYPEESVQAALDAKVKKALPVHWCGFALAQHHWKDPIERFYKEAAIKKLEISTPNIGQLLNYNSPSLPWWEAFK